MASSKLQTARTMMVDSQVRPNKVTDTRVITAMRTLPREAFLPADKITRAYADEPVRLAADRVMLEPMVLARMVQLAAIKAGERVLVVAAAGGYGAAIISSAGAAVTALEEAPELLAIARPALAAHAPNVTLVQGALAAGWPSGAPYDCIFIEGAVEELPPVFAAQLAPTGRLVMLRAASGRVGQAVIGRLSQGALTFIAEFDCAVTPLPSMRRAPAFVF